MKTKLQPGKNSESLLVPVPEARQIKRRETRPLESDIEKMLLRSGFQPIGFHPVTLAQLDRQAPTPYARIDHINLIERAHDPALRFTRLHGLVI